MQAGYNDDKSFKPHTYINELADKKQPEHIRAKISDPEQLWYDEIAEYQGPIISALRPVHAVLHHKTRIGAGAIPSYELFHEITVGYDHA